MYVQKIKSRERVVSPRYDVANISRVSTLTPAAARG
jgi:hypothetical protein